MAGGNPVRSWSRVIKGKDLWVGSGFPGPGRAALVRLHRKLIQDQFATRVHVSSQPPLF